MSSRTSLRRVKRRSVGQRLLLCSPHTRRKRKLRRDFCFHYLNGYGKATPGITYFWQDLWERLRAHQPYP